MDFDQFQGIMQKLHEMDDQGRRKRERDIQATQELDNSTFMEFRHEICELYDSFERYDTDGSGFLDEDEVFMMLKEFGLMPRSQKEEQHLARTLDSICDASIDFAKFLKLIKIIRREVQVRKLEEHKKAFQKYDRDNSGECSFGEISVLFQDVGLAPKTRAEQEEIKKIIDE